MVIGFQCWCNLKVNRIIHSPTHDSLSPSPVLPTRLWYYLLHFGVNDGMTHFLLRLIVCHILTLMAICQPLTFFSGMSGSYSQRSGTDRVDRAGTNVTVTIHPRVRRNFLDDLLHPLFNNWYCGMNDYHVLGTCRLP
jgi:hypothetical protein